MRLVASAFLLIVGSIGFGQSLPGWLKDPSKKWPNDPALAKISRDLDAIRDVYPWNEAKVRALYSKFVVPNKVSYLRARYGEPLGKEAYFWSVALEAYFPELDLNRKLGFPSNPSYLLQNVSFPLSAEFMRVAYVVYNSSGQIWIPNTGFAHRLLKIFPNDPLVMEAAIRQFGLKGNTSEKMRALEMAEVLLKEYPDQEERYLPMMPQICASVRNATKDGKYHRMAIAYYDRMIANNKPYFVKYRKHFRENRAHAIEFGKKFGYDKGT